MSSTQCNGPLCPDKDKYNTLIYSITCNACYENKMKLINGANCKCTLIEVCDDCHIDDDEDIDYCICKEDYNNPNCEWCF